MMVRNIDFDAALFIANNILNLNEFSNLDLPRDEKISFAKWVKEMSKQDQPDREPIYNEDDEFKDPADEDRETFLDSLSRHLRSPRCPGRVAAVWIEADSFTEDGNLLRYQMLGPFTYCNVEREIALRHRNRF